MTKSTIGMEETNKIKVKRLRKEAQLPTYGSELASGFDVRAYDCVIWDECKQELTSLEMTEVKGEKGWI